MNGCVQVSMIKQQVLPTQQAQAACSREGDGWSPEFPFLVFSRSEVPVEGKVTHKPERSLTVTHARYVCDTSQERADRDLWLLRRTGTRCKIRPLESKFTVQQRRRGNTGEDQEFGP